jgi:hypothetical protein
MSEWKPIGTAPKDGREILLRARTREALPGGAEYVTDVYHGWWDRAHGNWARWPHKFAPTHWMKIPEL